MEATTERSAAWRFRGGSPENRGSDRGPSHAFRTGRGSARCRTRNHKEPADGHIGGQLRNLVLDSTAGQEFLSKAEEALYGVPGKQTAEAHRRASQIVNEEIAIQAAAAPALEAETARRLEPLAPWLPASPRQIQRILNGTSLYQAAALQHPTFPTAQR